MGEEEGVVGEEEVGGVEEVAGDEGRLQLGITTDFVSKIYNNSLWKL